MKVFIETASKTVSAMILVSLAISIMAQVDEYLELLIVDGDYFNISCETNPILNVDNDYICVLSCSLSGGNKTMGYCQIRRDGNKFCTCSEQLPPLENQKCGEAGVDGSFLERQKKECSDFCRIRRVNNYNTSRCVALENGTTKSECVCGEAPLEFRVCGVLDNAYQPFTEVQRTACSNFCRNGTTTNISSRCVTVTDVLTECICGALADEIGDIRPFIGPLEWNL